LYQLPSPEPPFELTVQVRLNDESGAAGLVFHADGADRHYGFYPSNGQLRLTCFDGPTVFQWRVLLERPSDHYRLGDWNRLKVRVEKDKLLCYVNDQLVMESLDTTFTQGRVGLAKFRQTEAEFRHFQVAKELGPMGTAGGDALTARIRELPALATIGPGGVAELAAAGEAAVESLRQRARQLETQSRELERLARDVHVARITAELGGDVKDRDDGFPLLRTALLIAKLDDEDIDVDGYVQEVDRMAAEVSAALPADASDPTRLAAMNRYLFELNGFHGARFNYYHRANSYLNRVIDDRAGLPITLSLLYLELGKRLGLTIEGVGLPGHFVVRFVPAGGDPPRLIDVFDRGKSLEPDDARRIVREIANSDLRDEHLRAMPSRMILRRMLANLRSVAERERDAEALLRYTEAAMAIDPGSVEERLKRASLRAQTGRLAACLADLDWFIEQRPPGIDVDGIRELRQRLERGP
jgi:regulator of sirC expression with transglutaminase-like and TPR domain